MTTPVYNRAAIYISVFVILNAILLFSLHLIPFMDLPSHLAEAAIYKHRSGSDTILPQFYKTVPWFFPNTFHMIFCSLFPSVETGNKIFYILTIFILHFSVFLIIKELKGNPWYGLLSFLLTYNYNVTFGFCGFSIAIPIVFLLFYVLLLDMKEDRFVWKITYSLLLILLFLMHAQLALFGLVLFGLMTVYRYWGNMKKLFAHLLLIPLPVLLMIFTWWFSRTTEKEESMISFLLNYYRSSYIKTFYTRFKIIFCDNYQLKAGPLGLAIGVTMFILILLPLVIFKKGRLLPREKDFYKQLAYPLILLFASLCCYGLLPDYLPGEYIIYQRFSPVVLLSVIILGSVLLRDVTTKWFKRYALIAGGVYFLLWFDYFYSFDKQNKEFSPAFFQGIGNEARLSGLIYDYKYQGRANYIHFPAYFVIWNKGVAAVTLIDYRFGIVRRGPKGSQIPRSQPLIGEKYSIEPDYTGRLNYLLVRGKAPVTPDHNLDDYYLFRQAGDWQLFRKKQEGK